MLNYTKHIAARPEADTETVEDMVARARRGLVRIPAFQRGLRWGAVEVVQLFDSIYKGYPIGSFLLRKGKAEAARVEMGPLKIDAPETHEALWVIDGQQRLTALTAGLSRPTPVPNTPEDAFIVYFDAVNETFHSPPKDGKISDSWVPVADLLDASGLSEWVFHWKHGRDPSLRTTVFEAGSRIRQYRIPLYVVDTDDEYLLRDIFYRTNNYGKSLEWEDVGTLSKGSGIPAKRRTRCTSRNPSRDVVPTAGSRDTSPAPAASIATDGNLNEVFSSIP
jgi:hypothetical protein